MNFNQKGQSALEYLMTYGWALVVIVIAVAALVVLINPSTIQGNTCDAKLGNLIISQSTVSPTQTQFVLVNQSGTAVNMSGTSANGSTALGFQVIGTECGTIPYNSGATLLAPSTSTLAPNQTATLTLTHPAGAGCSGSGNLGSGSYSLNYTLSYDAGNLSALTASAQCRGSLP